MNIASYFSEYSILLARRVFKTAIVLILKTIMAALVTSILSSTVGLLLNKARDKTADKFKDGDITDAKIREIIITELNQIQAKIDGLSRKDLLTSYNFLQEGVNLLKASLDKSEEKHKAVHNEIHIGGCEISGMPSDVESGILIEVLTLPQARRKVKINFDKEFESAKERFKDARKEATRAFCNEALSIKDRIFAAKLRIVSELLECLESPETAITNCLPFLETFHNLPAIQEIFLVYINGGYKSIFKKAERVENVKSVMLINYVLFRYVLEFGFKYCSPTTWPTIEVGDSSFRPIFDWQKISTRRSWGKEFIQPPNEVVLDEEIDKFVSAVNSQGEIYVHAKGETINVISRTGEVKTVNKLNYPGDDEVIARSIIGLAVDNNNNVYILMYLETRTVNDDLRSYVLHVFEENYKVKHNGILHFLNPKLGVVGQLTISKNNDIIIMMGNDPHVYVCDSTGQLKHKFKRVTSSLRPLTTSDTNEIFSTSDDLKTIHRYRVTEKEDLGLKTTKVPEGHVIRGKAFHPVICKIIVVTFIRKSDSYFLLRYSETGELENSTFLCKKKGESDLPVIRSHPSGPVAVLWKRSITFI